MRGNWENQLKCSQILRTSTVSLHSQLLQLQSVSKLYQKHEERCFPIIENICNRKTSNSQNNYQFNIPGWGEAYTA